MTAGKPSPGPLLGIFGGMGPLASAAFLKTIYELNLRQPEQSAPRCILLSDPSVPDRTEAIRTGSTAPVEILRRAIDDLVGLGAARVVVSCITLHHFVPELPADSRHRLLSLVDVALEAVEPAEASLLLLCTQGTHAAGLFSRHPLWEQARDRVRVADEPDRERIHEMVYRLKQNEPPASVLPEILALLHRYGASSYFAGCTEFHLLTRHLMQSSDPELRGYAARAVDPLLLVARDLERHLAPREAG